MGHTKGVQTNFKGYKILRMFDKRTFGGESEPHLRIE